MIYGYCRISTAKQSIERQERNILSAYPDAMIILETFTGTLINRKELERQSNNAFYGMKNLKVLQKASIKAKSM